MSPKRRGKIRRVPWLVYAAAAALLAPAYWLIAPTSTLKIAWPDPGKAGSVRVGTVDAGANRYSFPLGVRRLDAEGLAALRGGEFQAAADSFTESLKKMPRNPRALAGRGTALILLDRLEEARKDYESAMLLENRLEEALSIHLSRAFYQRGHKRIDAKETAAARGDLERAIALNAKNALAFQELASLDILQGDYAGCVARINRALEVDQTLKLAYDNRGACYSALGRHKEALEDLDKAILLYPGRAQTYGTRAGVKVWLKDYTGALADAEKAGELNPELKSALRPLLDFARSQAK